AVGPRSCRARCRKAATSASSARWRMSWAPSRPTSASLSGSPIPSLNRVWIWSSIRALGAILSMGVVLPPVVLFPTSGAYASLLFQQTPDATHLLDKQGAKAARAHGLGE